MYNTTVHMVVYIYIVYGAGVWCCNGSVAGQTVALLCLTVRGWLAIDRKSWLLGRYCVHWAERGKGIGLASTACGIDH